MEYETVVKYIIGILALVVIIYLTYMFFTQAGGKTKWTVYSDDSGTIPYVSDAVRYDKCISKIRGCADFGGTDFANCNGIELASVCNTLCGKYCKQKQLNATCGDGWKNINLHACVKNELYSVSVRIDKGETTQSFTTEKNKNLDKLNIIEFNQVFSVKDGETINVVLNKGSTQTIEFEDCYIVYVDISDNNINILKFEGNGPITIQTTPIHKYIISTSCLLKSLANSMDSLCVCK